MTRLHPVLLAAFLAASLHTSVQAQSAPSTTSRDTSTQARQSVPEADRDFMKAAAEAGHAEVQGARLALSKSTSPEVKTYAQMLVDDHTRANTQLEQLAKSKGVKLPTEPSLMHKGKLQMLKMSKGADFDKRFAEEMGVEAHRKVIELFRDEVANGRDPQIKSFAQETLPKLEHHLELAQQLQNEADKQVQDKDNRRSGDKK